ncbi:MAG: septum site-determining protein MinC [Candidatus Poribacteria bacterium]|nr:septum site-determining protein MinC [Candidatus Poribacteria bacterium]
MANSIVALRAYRDGLHLIIRPHLSIEEVEEAIQQEISRMNQPLIGASVQIDLKCPTLKKEEAAYLKSKLQETYNLTVRSIEALDEQVPPPIAAAPTTHAIAQAMDTSNNRESEPSRIIPYTIRSGQTENFPQGSLIIYGDVNSGAEVRAGGDIVVLGALRGNAHAGINGRLSAVVIAMDLVPVQLQIGNFISRRPINQKSRGYPEIARIGVEDVIIVEKFVKF